MPDTLRRQYLEALGISTWSPREAAPAAVEPATAEIPAAGEAVPRASLPAAPEAPARAMSKPAVDAPPPATGVKLGPGRDGILLLCAGGEESASRLANDIARALGAVPVWAWPEAGSGAVSIENAVAENLFTEVAVFGAGLAAELFAGDVPESIGSASVVQLPSMAEIRAQAGSRRALWNALCRAGMVKPER